MNLREDWLGIGVGALGIAAVFFGISEGDVHTTVLAFAVVNLSALNLLQKRTIRSLREKTSAGD